MRFLFAACLSLLPWTAHGSPCSGATDPGERLACYDNLHGFGEDTARIADGITADEVKEVVRTLSSYVRYPRSLRIKAIYRGKTEGVLCGLFEAKEPETLLVANWKFKGAYFAKEGDSAFFVLVDPAQSETGRTC